MSRLGAFRRAGAMMVTAALCAVGAVGCVLHDVGLIPPPVPPAPAQGFEIRDDDLAEVAPPKEGTDEAALAGAHELYRRGEYGKARTLFHYVAGKKKAPVPIVQEAIFYEAECNRLQGRYPTAAETYAKLLKEFPNSPFREQAQQHAFEIANFWLDDTRNAMKEAQEVKEGKRWFVNPYFFQFEKSKPFADEEGRAVQLLEQVHLNDINGEMGLGDRALFLAGGVAYFNQNYEEADHFFTQIHERHGKSALAPKAVEYAIISKNYSTGGPDYDGRKVAEARFLVQSAVRNYPELARNKQEFLARQLAGLDAQQAAKEYRQAEFYRRRGKPGAAYWCYSVVRRRYPKTKYANLSAERMAKLEAKHGPFKRAVEQPAKVEAPKPIKAGEPLQPIRRPTDFVPPPAPRPEDSEKREH